MHSQSEHSAEQEGVQAVTLQPEIREQLRELTDTSSAGLTEEPGPTGGYTVDLKGRYKTVPIAIIGEDGEVKIHEYTTPPPEQ